MHWVFSTCVTLIISNAWMHINANAAGQRHYYTHKTHMCNINALLCILRTYRKIKCKMVTSFNVSKNLCFSLLNIICGWFICSFSHKWSHGCVYLSSVWREGRPTDRPYQFHWMYIFYFSIHSISEGIWLYFRRNLVQSFCHSAI